MDFLTGILTNFFATHPQVLAWVITLVAIHTLVKSFVDALVSSRAQWDATPTTDDNWYEKALTFVVRAVGVVGKVLAYLAGFRPKPKAETIIENPK